MATDPRVDVIVAVHDPSRPVERAVGSVLDGTRAPVRVTVVAHNTEPDGILDRLGALQDDVRVRLIELQDGIRSPAGPFNAGLDAATAPFTSVLGSDDTLQTSAIDSWLRVASSVRADVVISRLRHAAGRAVPTPPTRPMRGRALDGVRDRLSYRSAPLGLVSRNRFADTRFATGLAVGEDVPYVTRLWFSGARVAYDRHGPAYLIHDDIAGRTTFMQRPIVEELAFLHRILDDPWFRSLPDDARASFVVKALRIHLFGAVGNRPDPSWWAASERSALTDVATRLIEHGAGIAQVLSRRDRSLLDAILDPASDPAAMIDASRARRQFARPGSLLPRRLDHALRREAPLRMASASALQLIR